MRFEKPEERIAIEVPVAVGAGLKKILFGLAARFAGTGERKYATAAIRKVHSNRKYWLTETEKEHLLMLLSDLNDRLFTPVCCLLFPLVVLRSERLRSKAFPEVHPLPGIPFCGFSGGRDNL
jgi:hypothetical protein